MKGAHTVGISSPGAINIPVMIPIYYIKEDLQGEIEHTIHKYSLRTTNI